MTTYKKTVVEILDVRHPKAAEAPYIVDDMSLAFALGIRVKTLWFCVLRKNMLYKEFKIPKKSGKFRIIHEPAKTLKNVQALINGRILNPLQLPLGPHVAAFRPSISISDAASLHTRKCEVCASDDPANPTSHECPKNGVKMKLDLEDFFPRVRRSWVREYLHNVVGYNHKVSEILATLMTVGVEYTDAKHDRFTAHVVPQGAPTSPAICNLIADHRLDQHIIPALRKWDEDRGTPEDLQWRYTRYADDLYLSHGQNLDREEVGEVYKIIKAKVRASGWKLNHKKTQIQRPHRRQHMLGVVMNKYPNIKKESYQRIRCMLHNIQMHGWESQVDRADAESVAQLKSHIQGMISYFKSINPNKAAKLEQSFKTACVLLDGNA